MNTLFNPLKIGTPNAGVRYFCSSRLSLAGHSKWANIKHKKAANDAAKAAASFRMSRQIQVMAKMGGADLAQNIQLANAIDKAKSMSIPKKVIESAIKRGTGELKSTEKMETVLYEGLAPGGVSVVIEAITDNKNRTIGYVRPCFNKFNLNMSPTLYQFERKGVILLDVGEKTSDDVFEEMLELGCEDINEIEHNDENELLSERKDGNLIELVTDPKDFGRIAKELKDKYKIKEMNIEYLPNEDTMVTIEDPDTMRSFEKFMALLDDIEDISQVYTNLKED
ncbi:putative transcriptional regulatory protein HAH1 [Pichia kudriavzevii]|uniref:Putative transcriptional regulatory protein HAH1 n=1 Tax=Pichia kudriavzevii TaxID=4909 RepID=A0A1V2LQX0_PICKU|nr:putative transcriptional regulatory protein HAH1 [Pichia kudriavzevii]